MIDVPGDSFFLSTNQILVRRTRLILLICLIGSAIFTTLQIAGWQPGSWPTVAVHLLGFASIVAGLMVLQSTWAVRHAWLVTITTIATAYVMTALGRAVTVSGEYATTAILFVGAALSTATIIPWGMWMQALTVAVGGGALLAAIWYRDHSFGILASDTAAAAMVGFALSLIAAREITNYRLAHRRELIDRKRAERAVRRLAARLEQRVLERTVALERAHEELHRHQAELAHVLRLHTIGEMASALAHEINQPLCAITNYAQGALQRLRHGRLDIEGLRHACEEIAHEGLRAGEILRSIRALVRRESTISCDVDVNALAADAVRVIHPQAREHGVTVRLESGADLPRIQADGTQIEQVMLNLMLNGVQAAAVARVLPREVVVATTAEHGEVQVTVRDTGRGFAPSVRDRLFTPFLTTKEHGLGLGLVISRSIVESHGGRLWATSRDDAGTTFRFSLPAGAGFGGQPPRRAD
jgi:C4-dicarboxylate-specific signal transduction histidine kinase